MPRQIAWQLQIDWDFDGTYTDESARLISATGDVRFTPLEQSVTAGRGTADRMTLILNNADGRYSPLLTTGALYSVLTGGGAYHAPMRLNVSVDGGSNYYRVFTGVIKTPQERAPTATQPATVTIDCRSRDELLLNKRVSTRQSVFASLHDNGATEEQIIERFLEDAGLADGTDFTSQAQDSANATLDKGAFVIPWAWLDDESPVEDCWQLAAACGGRFYCDHNGVFRYEGMGHWLKSPHTTSQETISASGYGALTPTYDDRELYQDVTVEVAPRDLLQTSTLWSADSTIVVPAGGSKTVTARLRQPAYMITATNYTAVTAGSRDISANVTVGLTKYAQRVEIAITNADATYAAEVVALEITGVPVSGGPSSEVNAASTNAFWTTNPGKRPGRTRQVSGNAYIQTEAQAGALAAFLRDRHELPRLFFALSGVPGVPTRRLGDRITIANSHILSSSRDAFIIGLSFRLSKAGFAQDITAMDATTIYPYSSYFVVGTNKAGGNGDTGAARIFY